MIIISGKTISHDHRRMITNLLVIVLRSCYGLLIAQFVMVARNTEIAENMKIITNSKKIQSNIVMDGLQMIDRL